MREIANALRFLAAMPGAGHLRQALTTDNVKVWPVFSYLIIYDHAPRPIGIARVLHGRRDVAAILARTKR